MPSLEGIHQAEVSEDQAGMRIDAFLASLFDGTSRNRMKKLVKEGFASINGEEITDPSKRIKSGEVCVVEIPDATEADPEPEEIPLDIAFEDDHLIVINKPAGMVVHPAAGNWSGTLVNALLFHCAESLSGIGGVRRPGIVHRIDKDTSGLMVVAKTDDAHHGLADLFASHDIERVYKAIVWGRLYPKTGQVNKNIGRDSHNRKRMAIVESGGKTALTHYQVLENFRDIASLVECRLATGRTHQIRVHMTHLMHPLIGDPVYTRSKSSRVKELPEPAQKIINKFRRQALHAGVLGFIHPITKQHLKFETEFPSDMKRLIEALKS
jgi:23S rRNA pseudouridine1911/1915/1917 synthase